MLSLLVTLLIVCIILALVFWLLGTLPIQLLPLRGHR